MDANTNGPEEQGLVAQVSRLKRSNPEEQGSGFRQVLMLWKGWQRVTLVNSSNLWLFRITTSELSAWTIYECIPVVIIRHHVGDLVTGLAFVHV